MCIRDSFAELFDNISFLNQTPIITIIVAHIAITPPVIILGMFPQEGGANWNFQVPAPEIMPNMGCRNPRQNIQFIICLHRTVYQWRTNAISKSNRDFRSRPIVRIIFCISYLWQSGNQSICHNCLSSRAYLALST